MRIFGPSGLRTHFRDRGQSTIHRGSSVGLVGGDNIVIGTYTVPTARRALIESGYISFHITTALAAGQTLVVEFQGAGGGFLTPVAEIESGPGATGPDDDHATAGQVSLAAGQVIEIRGNLSAGAGIATVRGGFHGLEFDQ